MRFRPDYVVSLPSLACVFLLLSATTSYASKDVDAQCQIERLHQRLNGIGFLLGNAAVTNSATFGGKSVYKCVWGSAVDPQIIDCFQEAIYRYKQMIAVDPATRSARFESEMQELLILSRILTGIGFYYSVNASEINVQKTEFLDGYFPDLERQDERVKFEGIAARFARYRDLASKFCELSRLKDSDFLSALSRY